MWRRTKMKEKTPPSRTKRRCLQLTKCLKGTNQSHLAPSLRVHGVQPGVPPLMSSSQSWSATFGHLVSARKWFCSTSSRWASLHPWNGLPLGSFKAGLTQFGGEDTPRWVRWSCVFVTGRYLSVPHPWAVAQVRRLGPRAYRSPCLGSRNQW